MKWQSYSLVNLVNLLLIILSVVIGCAHIPKPILPSYIKRINIPIFANKTFKYGLEEELTEETIKAFILDGRLIVDLKGGAQGELRGEIISYSKEALLHDDEGYVTKYRLWIRISLLFYDLINKEVLFRDELIESVTYIPETSSLVGQGVSPETEEEAGARVLKILATRIVSRTIDGW